MTGVLQTLTMNSFRILNALTFQNYAWLGCVPNHLKIMGVFVTDTMKFFAQILIVLGVLGPNFLWLGCLTA